jgi:hypothetical protein
MRRAHIVAISVIVVLVAGIWTGAYLLHRAYTLPGATCGTAFTGVFEGGQPVFGTVYGTNAAALRCFTTAAAGCRAASIHLTVNGTDVTYYDVYAIRSGGPPGRCQVTDYGQVRMWSGGGSLSRVKVTQCRVAGTATGATIACPGVWPVVLPK